MEMQDNEFDKLFSSKLDDYEMEPSGNVWRGITDELDKNKRKKVIYMPFLSIAASIVVLITAGILFIPKKNETTKQRPVKSLTAKISPPYINSSATATMKQSVSRLLKPASATFGRVAVWHRASKQNMVIAQQKELITGRDDSPLVSETPPRDADLVEKNDTKAQSAIMDSAAIAAIKPVAVHPEKQVIIATNLPAAVKSVIAPPAKKQRLKSFGDVLNVVIAAVDKRKNKIIEFSDTDDDEATITAVNLGIIKVKKED